MASVAAKERNAPYREARTFASRKKLSASLRETYPACVPVIVERASTEKQLVDIDKRQFLVPQTMTVGNFVYIVRGRLGLSSRSSLFLYAGKTALSCNSSSMSDAYNTHHDPDGFLYLQYRGEDTFGAVGATVGATETRNTATLPTSFLAPSILPSSSTEDSTAHTHPIAV